MAELRTNTVILAKLGKLAKIPLITTASEPDGPNGPLMHELKDVAPGATYVPRKGEIKAWDNEDFIKTVKATGHKTLIIAGVWTSLCEEPAVRGVDADGLYDLRNLGRVRLLEQRPLRVDVPMARPARANPYAINARECLHQASLGGSRRSNQPRTRPKVTRPTPATATPTRDHRTALRLIGASPLRAEHTGYRHGRLVDLLTTLTDVAARVQCTDWFGGVLRCAPSPIVFAARRCTAWVRPRTVTLLSHG